MTHFLIPFGMREKHRDSKNDWRGSCEIKMNNLEFSRLLINLKIVFR